LLHLVMLFLVCPDLFIPPSQMFSPEFLLRHYFYSL
jgi:hypothetical protein